MSVDLTKCAICKTAPPRKGAMCCEPCRFEMFGPEKEYTIDDLRKAFEAGMKAGKEKFCRLYPCKTKSEYFDDYIGRRDDGRKA